MLVLFSGFTRMWFGEFQIIISIFIRNIGNDYFVSSDFIIERATLISIDKYIQKL